MYPTIPTIPMIMNCDLFRPGDELSWSFHNPPANFYSPKKIKCILKKFIKSSDSNSIRISLVITQEMIDKCIMAKRMIKKCVKIPDLGEFIPQLYPERMFDTSKFLVELFRN